MATGTKQPVPTVDAVHLRQALALVYTWADLGDDNGDTETMPGGDLHNLLERLARDLGVRREIVIALFKRSIVLAAYCAGENLLNSLFDDGFPGRQLCTAAAKSVVIDILSTNEGEMGHTFDSEEMRLSLLAAGN